MSAALTIAVVRPVAAPSPRHLVVVSDDEIAAARSRFEAEEAKKAQCIALMKVDLQGHRDRLNEIANQTSVIEQQIAVNVRRLEEIKKDLVTACAEHKKQKKVFNQAQADLVQKTIESLRAERDELNAATRKLKNDLKKLCAEQETRTEQVKKLHEELCQLEKPVIIRPVAAKPSVSQLTESPALQVLARMPAVRERDSPLAIQLNDNWRDQFSEQSNLLAEKLIDYAQKNGKGFDIDADNSRCAMSKIHQCCQLNHSTVRYGLVWVGNTLKIVRVCGHWSYVAGMVYDHICHSLPQGYGMRLRTTSDLKVAQEQLVKQQDYLRRNSETVPCVKTGSSVVRSSPNQDWLAEQGVTPNTIFTCIMSQIQGTVAEMLFVVPVSGEIDWQSLTIDVIRQNTIASTWYHENKPDYKTMELEKLLKVWAKKKRTGRA